MKALIDQDYFTDYEILKDPYAWFEAVREKGPVYQDPATDMVIVTGYAEMLEVWRKTDDFSAIIGLQGAAAPLPFVPEGSDITEQVEAHRLDFLGGDLLVNYDDKQHSFVRSLISGLFTPSRLRANEEFIVRYSDEVVKDAVARGGCELIREISTPFVTLVIADLLGVPEADRQLFMDAIEAAPVPGSLNSEDNSYSGDDHPMVLMASYFARYVADRRTNPRDDVLSELSNAKFPDGTTPDLMEIVRLGTFLFGAGQDTSAKLFGNAMRHIVDQPGLQDQLRADPSLIPAMIEEVLRLEGSTKQTARLARKDTRIGDLEIPAGTRVMLAIAAGNRDPRRWENPDDFQLGRPRIKEHIAFGRGAHVCAGAPLARVEVRIILEKFLEYTAQIELDEAYHGPRGNRNLNYEPSFIIRGLADLKLKLTPRPGMTFVRTGASEPQKPNGDRAQQAPETRGAVAFSTDSTSLSALLADPAATELLDRHFPGVSADKRIGMAKSMTLRTIQKFAPAQFSDTALDALDADLAQL